MKRFLVNDPSAMRLVKSVMAEASESELAEHFARATFSLITEPGDRFAGELIRVLSPETVLELLIARTSSADFSARLSSVDCLDEIESRYGRFQELFTEAMHRWLYWGRCFFCHFRISDLHHHLYRFKSRDL